MAVEGKGVDLNLRGENPCICQPEVTGKDVDHNLLREDWKNTNVYGPKGCQHLVVDEGVDPDLHGGGGVVMVLLEDEHLR